MGADNILSHASKRVEPGCPFSHGEKSLALPVLEKLQATQTSPDCPLKDSAGGDRVRGISD